MLNHWSFPRPKNKLDSIFKVLEIFSNIKSFQKNIKECDFKEFFANRLEIERVKKSRKLKTNTTLIGQAYISWLKSLGLIFYNYDTNQFELTEDGNALLKAGNTLLRSDILERKILGYLLVSDLDGSEIHPFIFLLKVLKSTEYLTKKEIAEIVIVHSKKDTEYEYKKVIQQILQEREKIHAKNHMLKRESDSEKRIAVTNTIINWLEYTGLVRYDSAKGLIINDVKRVNKILNNIQSLYAQSKTELEKGLYFVHGYYSEEVNDNMPYGDHIILFRDGGDELYDIDVYDVNLRQFNFRNQSWLQGEYVFYDGENINIADNEKAENYKIFNERLIDSIISGENFVHYLHPNQDKERDNVTEVYSYHINVGHGNCSVIIFNTDKNYNMWMVDCSIYDFLNKKKYFSNLDACLDELEKKYGITKISKLFVTHLHYDHINGIPYLIEKGLIDENTEVWMNILYPWPYKKYNSILKQLIDIGVKFIDPIIGNSTKNIKIRYPKKSYDKSFHAPQNNINNASVLYQICLDGKSMLFTGDLEQGGWDSISDCNQYLWDTSYYCISHHGSLNGHKRFKCVHGQIISSLADCGRNTQLQVLMGRDGAYKGIFSLKVKKDFKNIKYTDGKKKYIKVNWKTGDSKNV